MPREQTPTRDRADELGIKYHHNAADATIQALIDAHDAAQQPGFEPMAPEECEPMTKAEYQAKYDNPQIRRKNANRLVRCRIQCMNPAKKEWPGEIISVGSAKLGTFKKYIPFNSPEPYHIPQIIYDMLREKKCTVFYTSTDDRGNKIRKGRLVDEYAIEVLPQLSKEELSDLGRKQALQAGQQ